MRVLTNFALKWAEEDPIGIELVFRGSPSPEEYSYPEECVDDDPKVVTPLEKSLQDACAAQVVEFGDDNGVSRDWFDQWLFDSDGPLGARREPPPPVVEEMAADLSGSKAEEEIAVVEVSGDLSGEQSSEALEGSTEVRRTRKNRKVKKRVGKIRKGSGCKQPDKVNGWESGRLLCVVKNHRTTESRNWGRCEYRVRCNADGSYTLEFFAGNRTDIAAGDKWETVSDMWWALLALGDDDPRALLRGKQGTRHHRMTIKRFFNL